MNDRRNISGLTPAMEQATEWFVRLHESPGEPVSRAEFDIWRAADPAHAVAYDRVQRLWGASAHLPALAQAPARPDRRAMMAGLAGLGGGALILTAGGRLALGPHPFADYRTRAGEMLEVTLRDGTAVTLSTASALAVDFSADRRRLGLLDGEAWFRTAVDPSRPLTVEVAGARILTADGAAFGLRAQGRRGRLGVAERSVSVSVAGRSGRLDAGQTATFGREGLQAVSAFDGSDFAWREGQLVFVNQPLGEVVAALDRWTGARTVVRGDELAARPVTLITRTQDAGRGLEQLQRATPLSIERLGPLTVVRAI